MRIATRKNLALVALTLAGCGTSGGLHPPAPPTGGLGPVPDPPPSVVLVHTTLFSEGLQRQLDRALPREGGGELALVAGKTLHYTWDRRPLALAFDRGRIVLTTDVTGHLNLLGDRSFPIRLRVAGEPVVTADYQARLQSTTVEVKAEAPVAAATIEEAVRAAIADQLEGFRLDLRPTIEGAYRRIARPLPFRLGEGGAEACALLRVAGIQAGPTVLAGGVEKDLALTVLPAVVMPCPAAPAAGTPAAALPLLANVATLGSGPFSVTVPVAASYQEISAALAKALGGRLFFSKDYPGLYLEKPEVFPSRDTLVIRVVLGGTVRTDGGIAIGGELYFSGHPRVIDNQLTIPDLELTPGTASGLLRLKVLLDGKAIRDQAQAALRVDLSERIAAARGKLSTELSFAQEGVAPEDAGCLRAEALRTEVTGIYPHEAFLRIYVVVSAQAAMYLPCRR